MKISILSPDLSINCLGRAYLLARILQRHYEVEIVGPITSGDGIWWPVAHDKNIKYKSVKVRGGLKAYWRMRELAGMIEGDVVYACKPLPTSFGMGLLKKKLHHVPLVLDIDDWEMGMIREYCRGLSLIGWLRYLGGSTLLPYRMGSYWNIMIHEKLVRCADEITVSNRFLQKRFGGELIWHARDTEAFDSAGFCGDATRKKLGIDKNEKVVMFFGTPRPVKGLEDAIEALSLIEDRNVILIIVGMGKDRYCQKLVNIGEEKLRERFKYFGLQPFDRLPEFLAMADIVIIPQKRNLATVGQLPAKVFDAMAMAKPIIATRVSDLPEILDGCGWIVEPDSPEKLADGIEYILENPEEAGARGRRARQKCVEKYSWDAMEEVLVNVFRKYG